MKKRFAAAIYLDQGGAVKNRMDRTLLKEKPEELARYYSDLCADELIVFDLSETDEEHEEAIAALKRIVEASEVPVCGCGHIRRFEDVKKILYTGAAACALNFSRNDNVDLAEEVSKRFGKDKICACVGGAGEIEGKKSILNEFVSRLILIGGADDHYQGGTVSAVTAACALPFMLPMPDAAPGQISALLKKENVAGVFGPLVNANINELNAMKSFCAADGAEVNGFDAKLSFAELKINADGLVPVIVQDYRTKEVLMMAWMNEEAYNATISSGRMTYYSRSRQSQWIKGETSGHFQYLKELSADCDKDTLLAKVNQIGAACHTGSRSCFFNEIVKKDYIDTDPMKVFEDVYAVIKDRKEHPKEGSYTNYLFDKGIDKILKKVGEECTEIVIAAKNPDPEEIKYEISDFLYHAMVLMVERGVSWEDITRELARR
ncbi:MAG: bifunctional phosphoribosyl-AMP cyclohydrolase/phosphoribosyl-ATP diphosphatase HisIE [Lachnospiraceae bacterium]|nr:bifunctional phosphoribosyl-AMP cyclohydrolase/phosphoribosyl-ATP diphosphatase HisIE [Lachnospiraceae bacterium]